jgi:hypothetical protein
LSLAACGFRPEADLGRHCGRRRSDITGATFMGDDDAKG